MTVYRLTEKAAADFESIFTFSIDAFGTAQAIKYANGLKQRFDEIAGQPARYPEVSHIAEGYRRSVYGAHAIYYRVETGGVVIVRILSQQTTEGALPV